MIRLNLFAGLPRSPGGASVVKYLLLAVAALIPLGIVVVLVVLMVRALGSDSGPEPPPAAPVAAAPPAEVRIPYATMSLPQRVAYEISFTRQALDALNAAIVPELGSPSLVAVDSFATVLVEGQSKSKEAVVGLLAKLRTDDLTLAPKPRTSVTAASGHFSYRAAADARFALGNYDSTMSRLPQTSVQSENVKRLEQFAADAGVKIRKGLRYASTQKAGRFQRLVYRMDASADLAALTAFVRNVQAANLGCAFANVRLSAGAVSADVYLNAIE